MRENNYTTRAWRLGAETSYIEIYGKNIETMANSYIALALQVNVKVCKNVEGAGDEVAKAAKGLRVDLSGLFRVVVVKIDSKMCCGTHVTNLAQIQTIKLLNIERTKGKL